MASSPILSRRRYITKSAWSAGTSAQRFGNSDTRWRGWGLEHKVGIYFYGVWWFWFVQRAVGLRAEGDEELEQAPRERGHLVGVEARIAARHDSERAWLGLGLGLGLG